MRIEICFVIVLEEPCLVYLTASGCVILVSYRRYYIVRSLSSF